jgi:hypothetical protein
MPAKSKKQQMAAGADARTTIWYGRPPLANVSSDSNDGCEELISALQFPKHAERRFLKT